MPALDIKRQDKNITRGDIWVFVVITQFRRGESVSWLQNLHLLLITLNALVGQLMVFKPFHGMYHFLALLIIIRMQIITMQVSADQNRESS